MANEQIGLETVIKNDDFQKGLQTYTNGLQTMNRVTDQAAQAITNNSAKMGTSWREFGNTIDRTGRQSMIGIRAVSEGLAAIGLPPGIVDATRGAANMADTLGDLGGAAASINPTFLALGAVAATVAVGLWAVSEASKANAKYITDAVKPAEDLYQAIKKINEQRELSRKLGIDPERLGELAKLSPEAGQQVEKFTEQYLALEKVRAKSQLGKSLAEDINIISLWRAGIFSIEEMFNTIGTKDFKIPTLQTLRQDAFLAEQEVVLLGQKLRELGTVQVSGAQSVDLVKVAEQAQGKFIEQFNSSAKRISEIELDLADRRIDINQNAAQRIADIQGNLGHTLENLQRDYGKQLAQFAKQEVQIKNDIAKQIAQIERDTQKQLAQIDKDAAKSIAEINKNEAKSLADVDTNLRKSLRSARSARERREARLDAIERKKEIVTQAAERRAEIAAQAAERKQQIIEARNERLADIETQRQERLQTLAEQKQAAAEEFAFRRAEAKRAADEQIAQARRTAAEQIAAAQKAADKQTEAIKQALAEQRSTMETQMRGLQVSMGVAGNAIGKALGTGFVNGLAPLVNAEIARVMALINAMLAAMRNIQNFNPASLGTAAQASQVSASQASIRQPVSNNVTSNNRSINVTVPVTGSFEGMNQASVEAVAQRIADRTVTAILQAT